MSSGFSTNELLYPITKGDVPGHQFHGNQYESNGESKFPLHTRVGWALGRAGHEQSVGPNNRRVSRHWQSGGFKVNNHGGKTTVEHILRGVTYAHEFTPEERSQAQAKLAEYKNTLEQAGFHAEIQPPAPNVTPLQLPNILVTQ